MNRNLQQSTKLRLAATVSKESPLGRTSDPVPALFVLDRALRLVHRALEEGRAALRGLQLTQVASTSLEQALSDLGDEFTSQGRARVRVFALGRSKALKPAIRE